MRALDLSSVKNIQLAIYAHLGIMLPGEKMT
jgi:hypothetical protein